MSRENNNKSLYHCMYTFFTFLQITVNFDGNSNTKETRESKVRIFSLISYIFHVFFIRIWMSLYSMSLGTLSQYLFVKSFYTQPEKETRENFPLASSSCFATILLLRCYFLPFLFYFCTLLL